MDDKKILSVEELEAAAGGAMTQWTKAELARLHEMNTDYNRLCNEYAAGRITREELDKAFDDIHNYYCEIDKKYN